MKFSGKTEWFVTPVAMEDILYPWSSIFRDEIANENLDFLVVPQYRRNPNKTG